MKYVRLPPLFFSVRLPTLLAIFWRRYVRRGADYGLPGKHPLSFIIFRLDALGDVVMTTPLFRTLKTVYPESRCTVVVQEQYKSLLVTNPHIDEILTLPRIAPAWLPGRVKRLVSATWLYWTRLRRRHFDFAVSPRWDVDEHLATFLTVLTHTASRVGYTEKTSAAKRRINRGFDAGYDTCLPPGPVQHEVLRNLAIAEQLGAATLDDMLEVPLTERDRRNAARLLAKVPGRRKLIAIGIGAASPGRRWPLKRYAEVVGQLNHQHELRLVILCSGTERDQAMELADQLHPTPIMVCGAGLREVCAVLERCELFIGNDSGVAHLAAAMNCRVVVISRHPRDGDPNHFNSPLRFAPCCAQVRVLQPAQGLGDCHEGCGVAGPHCITSISVDRVVAAARAMLNEERTAGRRRSQACPDPAAQRLLLHSHSAEAIRRAMENLQPDATSPLTPV